ncbi:calcium-binding protein [Microvirga arabica]|nr:calcium-binding protein [Microvirga arabica]
MATATLTPTFIGRIGETGIYRVDLQSSGILSLNAVIISDDNVISGGSGSFSGIDIDFVKLSTNLATDASAVPSLLAEESFDFSRNGVVFAPGFLQPWKSGDDPLYNQPYLSGTDQNSYNSEKATLGQLDGQVSSESRAISLGEGGQLTFLLNRAISSGAKYLYIGDIGGGNDRFSVVVTGDSTPYPNPNPTIPAPNGVHIIGTQGKDVIILGQGINQHLGTGNDTIKGVGGHDVVDAAAGDDWLYGGAGNDKVAGNAGNDRTYGGTGHDTVSGGSGHDWVYGDIGRDTLHGSLGNDTLNGGVGNDVLYGNAGRDIFVFNTTLGTFRSDRKVNFDTIKDFNVRHDNFWLDNAVFKKVGKGTLSNPKQLNKEYFVAGSEAHEKDDYLIYNKRTGVLSYDSDGSGYKTAVEFAQLKKGLALTYKDFFVI